MRCPIHSIAVLFFFCGLASELIVKSLKWNLLSTELRQYQRQLWCGGRFNVPPRITHLSKLSAVGLGRRTHPSLALCFSHYEHDHNEYLLLDGYSKQAINFFKELASSFTVSENRTATLLNIIRLGDEWATAQQESLLDFSPLLAGVGSDHAVGSMRSRSLLDHKMRSSEAGNFPNSLLDPSYGFTRVPGCMATVLIKTELVKPPPESNLASTERSSCVAQHKQRQNPQLRAGLRRRGQCVVKVSGVADSRVARGMLAILSQALAGRTVDEILSLDLTPKCLSQLLHLDQLLPTGRLNGFRNMAFVVLQQLLVLRGRDITPDSGHDTFEKDKRGSNYGYHSSGAGGICPPVVQVKEDSSVYSEELKIANRQRVEELSFSNEEDNSQDDVEKQHRRSIRIEYTSVGCSSAYSAQDINETSLSNILLSGINKGLKLSDHREQQQHQQQQQQQEQQLQQQVEHQIKNDILNYIPLSQRREEVAMLLSGGVDSSVALALLVQKGLKVRAYYLKIWLEDEVAHLNECPWEEDLSYAQAVCTQLGVPLETVSLQKEYWQHVVQYTFSEARAGRTPNPDVMCNSRIKFGVFHDYIGRFHSKIATGHYAQVMPLREYRDRLRTYSAGEDVGEDTTDTDADADAATTEPVVLVQSPDAVKDQSYFLSNLNQQQLQRCLFPIGHLQKPRVRQLAEKFNLPTKNRKDSQGICFLGKLKFDEFIEHYLGESPGPIKRYKTHEIIGQHRGLWFHTIGQRKGIGQLLAPRTVHNGPWFVAAKDAESNTLYVTNDLQIVQQPRRSFMVHKTSWVAGVPRDLLSSGDSSRISNTDTGAPVTATASVIKNRHEVEDYAMNEMERAGEEKRSDDHDIADSSSEINKSSPGMVLKLKLRHSPHFVKGWVTVVLRKKTLNPGDGSPIPPTASSYAYEGGGTPAMESECSTSPTTATTATATATDSGVQCAEEVGDHYDRMLRVTLFERDQGIAPGQFAAFYDLDGTCCLGAGVIADVALD